MKFIKKFPTVTALASATEPEVLKQWEGLGYYRRARHLLEAAKFIQKEYNGVFPKEYKQVLALKGVGGYTAAAIVSFAYEQSYVAVDSNVERVIARYFGIPEVKSSLRLKKVVKNLLQPEIEQCASPGEFNQMMIDFGALVCTAKKPTCDSCPIMSSCHAYGEDSVFQYPKAIVKKKRVKRFLHYLIYSHDNKIGLQLRDQNDIWAGMYEFLLIETSTSTKLKSKQIMDYLCSPILSIDVIKKEYKQLLTHREIYGHFYLMTGDKEIENSDLIIWADRNSLDQFAFPGIIRLFLEENMHNFK